MTNRKFDKPTYRFDIVVINHNKLFSFINNLYKIKNIKDCDRFTIISDTPSDEERKMVINLKNSRYITRESVGGLNQVPISQYILEQIGDNTNLNSEFIFILQEHYLDTESRFSKWDNGIIKGDVISDGAFYDLDDLEHKYVENANLTGIYCDRRGPERFILPDGYHDGYYITTNGINFILRTEKLKRPEIKYALSILLSARPKDINVFNSNPKGNSIWSLMAEHLHGAIFFGQNETHYDIRRNKFIKSFDESDDFNEAPDWVNSYFMAYIECIRNILIWV